MGVGKARGAANRECPMRTFLPPLEKGSHSFRICTFQADSEADLKQEQHDLIAEQMDAPRKQNESWWRLISCSHLSKTRHQYSTVHQATSYSPNLSTLDK